MYSHNFKVAIINNLIIGESLYVENLRRLGADDEEGRNSLMFSWWWYFVWGHDKLKQYYFVVEFEDVEKL